MHVLLMSVYAILFGFAQMCNLQQLEFSQNNRKGKLQPTIG